ncbi:MAG TPA: nicotinamide riboside transporter PnuC [Flavisolibacter sp.]|nr:nicotinamide riboside transporter PnuC [Flavisolibacter sp.]
MLEFFEQVGTNLKNTTALEYIAVVAGIVSVWFSRKENIWVYPTGLVNTIIYIYICFKFHLLGEAAVNVYYSIMSLYGWWMWARKDNNATPLLHISFSNKMQWIQQLIFFLAFFVGLFFIITFLRPDFPGVIPAPDAFATAAAFTGMWLMARKKVESWWWWIVTNIASVPLYYVKGLALSSIFYVVLLVMAVFGLLEWQRKARLPRNIALELQS